jgi:hypothetical protein
MYTGYLSHSRWFYIIQSNHSEFQVSTSPTTGCKTIPHTSFQIYEGGPLIEYRYM